MKKSIILMLAGLMLFPLLWSCGQGGGSPADTSSPAQVVGTAASTAVSPQVASNESGSTMALWTQSDGSENGVYVNYFDLSTGLWSVAEPIAALTGMTYSPAVAVAPGGNAIAVWREYDNGQYHAWVKRYSHASASWSPAEAIAGVGANEIRSPRAAIDGQGNALVVWYQSNGQAMDIWGQSFSVASGWSNATLIEQESGSALFPKVAMDGRGNGLVVWIQAEGTRNNIKGAFFQASAGWSEPIAVESVDKDASAPNVAMNTTGEVVVTWYQWEGEKYSLWGRSFNGSWNTPGEIESDFAGGELDVQVALAADGRGVVVWKQHDGERQNIWRSLFDPVSGWSLAEVINGGSSVDLSPKTTVTADGDVVAVWVEYGSDGSTLWANTIQ